MRKLLIVLTAALVLAACGSQPTAQRTQHHPSPSASASAKASASPAAGAVVPTKVTIQSIGLSASVEKVGVDQYGDMAIPVDPHNLGWYSPGVKPGAPGDAVIDGHYDWYGMPQGPLFKLTSVKAGDEIDITSADGNTLTFKVTAPATAVPYDSHPAGLFRTDGAPTLTLITCGGEWDASKNTYTERELLNATLVKK
jgi:hypothetical protein